MIDDVLTIVTGKEIYANMASKLSRSVLWWHPKSDIKFMLVTDQKEFVPADLVYEIEIINLSLDEFGEGIASKLSLNKFVDLKPLHRLLFGTRLVKKSNRI